MLKYLSIGAGLASILFAVLSCSPAAYRFERTGPRRAPLPRTREIRVLNEKDFNRKNARFTELGVLTVEDQNAGERLRIARDAAREKGANLILKRPARAVQRLQVREQVDMQSPSGFQQVSNTVLVHSQEFILLHLQSGGDRYARARDDRYDREDRPDEGDFESEDEGDFRDRGSTREIPKNRKKERDDFENEKQEVAKKEEEKPPSRSRDLAEEKNAKSPVDPRAIARAMIRSNFTDNENATFTGARTGLMWSRCSMGQSPGFGDCRGHARMVPYQEAVQYCRSMDHAGQRWRLPRKGELEEVYRILMAINTAAGKRKGELIDVIQEKFFPGVEVDVYWTESVYRQNKNVRWVVDFSGGDVFPYDANNKGLVRCVSDGPRK